MMPASLCTLEGNWLHAQQRSHAVDLLGFYCMLLTTCAIQDGNPRGLLFVHAIRGFDEASHTFLDSEALARWKVVAGDPGAGEEDRRVASLLSLRAIASC